MLKSATLGHRGSQCHSRELARHFYSQVWILSHQATNALTLAFGMERGEKVLRDIKEKEGRDFSSYIIVPFHHLRILQTFFLQRGVAPQFMFESPFLYWALFLAPGVTLIQTSLMETFVTIT